MGWSNLGTARVAGNEAPLAVPIVTGGLRNYIYNSLKSESEGLRRLTVWFIIVSLGPFY